MDYRIAEQIWEMIAGTSFTGLRVYWQLSDIDTRTNMDGTRTAEHDAFIDAGNILSRNVAKQSEENEWRRLMTDNSKEIGDFACHLHAILCVTAR